MIDADDDGFEDVPTRPSLCREEIERELARELMDARKIPTFAEALEVVRATMTNDPQPER